jgi:tetratricopeptide (TPR) repeat protein
MSIKTAISKWLQGSTPQAPKPQKDHLFDKTGWGPAQRTDHFCPHPYKGPLYRKAVSSKVPHPSRPSRDMCNKARRLWSEGRFTQAEETYQQAINQCPTNPDFHFEVAQLLWGEGRLDEAQEKLRYARTLDPLFTPAVVSSLRVYLEQGYDPVAMLGVLAFHETTPALRQLRADVCAASPFLRGIEADVAAHGPAA